MHRSRDRGERSLVENEFDAADRVVNALITPQLPFDDLDVVRERCQIAAVARGEIVEDTDAVPTLNECSDEVRPDKARTAGDENLHAGVSNSVGSSCKSSRT